MNAFDSALNDLHSEDPLERAQAVKALGKIANEQAITAVINTLGDESIAVVRSAILALGTIGGCMNASRILPFVDHENLWLRKASVEALGKAHCQDVVPRLVELLADEDLHTLAREALVALKVDPDFF